MIRIDKGYSIDDVGHAARNIVTNVLRRMFDEPEGSKCLPKHFYWSDIYYDVQFMMGIVVDWNMWHINHVVNADDSWHERPDVYYGISDMGTHIGEDRELVTTFTNVAYRITFGPAENGKYIIQAERVDHL